MDAIPFLTLLWLFLLAAVAGIVDAMAGGGGLLTLPALLAVGLDPVSALATNKSQGIFSSLSATIHFRRKGKLKLREHIVPAGAAFIGGFLGATSISMANPQFLKMLVPFLLIAVALWVLFSQQLGHVQRKARISFAACALTLIPVGFYDGFLGPGAGTFYALGMVGLLGLTLHEATLRAKIYNFASNLGGLSFFLFSGHIVWAYGLTMIAGTIIGGNIGARLIIRHGTNLIKPVLVAMSLAMSAKLLWQQGFIQKLFMP
jgi:uncharacterized protein